MLLRCMGVAIKKAVLIHHHTQTHTHSGLIMAQYPWATIGAMSALISRSEIAPGSFENVETHA